MEKFVKYNKLFDCYSNLLTEKEKECFRDYYEEDLSLQEIAENNNVSRSAIHKTVKNVEDKLDYYEDVLKLNAIIDKLKEIEAENEIQIIKQKVNEILENF
ncbi:MAG: HTH domain-containing protein [Bacilli bacterium]|nr:HTH domain-containing protein [Bacilli bacterium]